jgi:hypothetical protein
LDDEGLDPQSINLSQKYFHIGMCTRAIARLFRNSVFTR